MAGWRLAEYVFRGGEFERLTVAKVDELKKVRRGGISLAGDGAAVLF